MQGRILFVNENADAVLVAGADNGRYQFPLSLWRGEGRPRRNAKVEFHLRNGEIVAIAPPGELQPAEPAPAPPAGKDLIPDITEIGVGPKPRSSRKSRKAEPEIIEPEIVDPEIIEHTMADSDPGAMMMEDIPDLGEGELFATPLPTGVQGARNVAGPPPSGSLGTGIFVGATNRRPLWHYQVMGVAAAIGLAIVIWLLMRLI